MGKILFLLCLSFAFCKTTFGKNTDTIPRQLQGDWLSTDGSNKWTFGFTGDKVFYDCNVWQLLAVQQMKKHVYKISFSGNEEQFVMYIKPAKDSNLLIGRDEKDMALFSRKKTIRNVKEEDLTQYIFKDDTAVYKGFIENYDTSLGRTGKVVVINPFIYGPASIEPYLISINIDGSFTVKVPVAYPQEVSVRFPDKVAGGNFRFPYLFPGETVFEKISGDGSGVFMGSHSVLNNEMNELKSVADQYNTSIDSIDSNVSPEQYKDAAVNVLNKELKTIDEIAAQRNISKNAAVLQQVRLRLQSCSGILYFINRAVDATAGKNGKKLSISEHSELFHQQAEKLKLVSLINDKLLAGKFSLMNNIDYFFLLNGLGFGGSDINRIDKAWHLQTHFLPDLFYAQKFMPNSTSDSTNVYACMEAVNRSIVSDTLRQYVLSRLNQRLQAIQSKNDYLANAPTHLQHNDVFDKIIGKYKGKTIFVDFWNTGCGPCLEGIVSTQNQREDMKNDPVVFLFMTDETSPLNTYNKWTAKMKGENYRLSTDDMNSITATFKFQGVPHYMIINKRGEMVYDDGSFDYSNLKETLTKYINAN